MSSKTACRNLGCASFSRRAPSLLKPPSCPDLTGGAPSRRTLCAVPASGTAARTAIVSCPCAVAAAGFPRKCRSCSSASQSGPRTRLLQPPRPVPRGAGQGLAALHPLPPLERRWPWRVPPICQLSLPEFLKAPPRPPPSPQQAVRPSASRGPRHHPRLIWCWLLCAPLDCPGGQTGLCGHLGETQASKSPSGGPRCLGNNRGSARAVDSCSHLLADSCSACKPSRIINLNKLLVSRRCPEMCCHCADDCISQGGFKLKTPVSLHFELRAHAHPKSETFTGISKHHSRGSLCLTKLI